MAEPRVNPYAGMSVAEIAAARREKAAAAPAARETRMAELKTQREAVALQRALARAASAPEFNFTQRPEGFIDEGNKVIRYYGWTGGKETGKWVAREAPLTQRNYDMYKGFIPATQIAVKDIKSRMVPEKAATDGFIVTPDGQIKTKGNVDMSILGVKSDLDMEKVLAKRGPREDKALAAALERAQKSPLTNFMERPKGSITGDKIYFYSWIGGKTDGEWVQYVAERTPENMNKYATRTTAQKYYTPTSIRDVLIPVTNIYGQSNEAALANRKVVSEFNNANSIDINTVGQINP